MSADSSRHFALVLLQPTSSSFLPPSPLHHDLYPTDLQPDAPSSFAAPPLAKSAPTTLPNGDEGDDAPKVKSRQPVKNFPTGSNFRSDLNACSSVCSAQRRRLFLFACLRGSPQWCLFWAVKERLDGSMQIARIPTAQTLTTTQAIPPPTLQPRHNTLTSYTYPSPPLFPNLGAQPLNVSGRCDFNDQLLCILTSHRLPYTPYETFDRLLGQVTAIFRTWDDLMKEFTNVIIARLRDRLGTARNANEMFRVFSKFNALFVRPKFGEVTDWGSRFAVLTQATVYMVKYYKSGHAAVSAFAEHPAVKGIAYTKHYARTQVRWNVSYAVVEEELRRQNSATIDFALCLGATSSERLAGRTKGKPASSPLDKKDEVVANVIWRFLELRG
ncbi:hypothetical protein R3P38DRAFT_3553475 [Favolaschia claudopus]|uniref:Uncharacterized protein n=1 Tax=Favolaschia claudopus TaxID=2862362 RepID=A0AAW0B0Q8_9AGAR